MKRHVANNKPSTNKLFNSLSAYKCNTKSEKKYTVTCRECKTEFTFAERDLKEQIYTCPNCGKQEIFFYCNFI